MPPLPPAISSPRSLPTMWIVEAEVAKRSVLAKGTLSEIKLPRGVLVAALKRGDRLLVPRGADRVEPGDRILLISTTENASKLADFLSE